MAFAAFDRAKPRTPSAEINMVPLIDVMLVLLVVFMVAAPMLHHSIPLDLPKESLSAQKADPQAITISINAHGVLHWNREPLQRQEAQQALLSLAAKGPQTEIRIHADQRVSYAAVAGVLADAQRAGLTRIAFVSEPLAH